MHALPVAITLLILALPTEKTGQIQRKHGENAGIEKY
jgi:hypothetical protein